MTTDWSTHISYKKIVHRNQKIILCEFPYDPELLKKFKKEFPSAKWSSKHKAWYLPDTTLYGNRLNMPAPDIGDSWLPRLYEHNKKVFIQSIPALKHRTLMLYTIKT